jgi:hypothetical protein
VIRWWALSASADPFPRAVRGRPPVSAPAWRLGRAASGSRGGAGQSARPWDHRARGLRRPHPATPTKRSACLPCSPSLIPISTSALPASALVTRSCSRATSYGTASKWVVSVWSAPLCPRPMRTGSRPSAHDLNPPRWTDHNPRHDRQQVAELHAADHRWLGSVSGRRRTSVSRDVSTPTQPQVELTFHLEL